MLFSIDLNLIIIFINILGGSLPWRVSLTLGLANIAANSLSIGISEFLSSKAHREFLQAEKRRELWEFKNYREAEIGEVS